MNTIRIFQLLREELNHTYLKAKLSTVIGADPTVALAVLENPKTWFQLKLRIELTFQLAGSILGIEVDESFAGCRDRIASTSKKIDQAIGRLRAPASQTNELRELLSELVRDLQSLGKLDYDLKAYPRYPSDGSCIPTDKEIELGVRSLTGIASRALLTDLQSSREFKQLSRDYWVQRCSVEYDLIARVVADFCAEAGPSDGIRPFLRPLRILDGVVEEALSPNYALEERVRRASAVSSGQGFSSLSEHFVSVEKSIVSLLYREHS